ncbi:MAG: hypothetical protein J6J27_01775 [Alphaproteobacteria bacterium]|nr:hypothetical protein [Alphaproteobacteria bacterium]
MFENNPFYTVNFVENDDQQTTQNIDEIANDNPSQIMENSTISNETNEKISTENSENIETTELKRDSVQEPEKKEEVKSTGVSTYTEVPSINKESIECNSNLISGIDRFNLWLVFAFFVWVLTSFKKRKFTRIIEKTTNIFVKYAGILNIILLIISFILFLYPKVLGTGISGKLDLFTIFEFALIIVINATVLTFLCFKFLRNKKILFKKPKTFAGINFLKKSLITFSLTGLLFFFFTESQIALSLLYIFSILTSLFFFIEKNDTTIETYGNFYMIAQGLQIAIIGGLSGLYIIMLIGTLLTGYYYPTIKFIINSLKENKEA